MSRGASFFSRLVSSQMMLYLSTLEGVVAPEQPAEQIAGWQMGDLVTKGLSTVESDNVPDWNFDPLEDGMRWHGRFGLTDSFEASHLQPGDDIQDKGYFSSALLSFGSYGINPEGSLRAGTVFHPPGGSGGMPNYQPYQAEDQVLRNRENIQYSDHEDQRIRTSLISREISQPESDATKFNQAYDTRPSIHAVSNESQKNQVDFMDEQTDQAHRKPSDSNREDLRELANFLSTLTPLKVKNIQPPHMEEMMGMFSEYYRAQSTCKDLSVSFDKFRFEGVPAVLYNGVIRILKESHTEYVEKKPLFSRMRSLISWFVLIGTATFRKFAPNSTTNDEIALHNELLAWLLKEMFFPTSSLPVFGVIKKQDLCRDHTGFQEIQKMILNFLSKLTSNESSIKTSSQLLLKWFRQFNPPILEFLTKFSTKSPFVFLCHDLIMETVFSNWKFKEEVSSSIELPVKINDFLLVSMEDLPKGILKTATEFFFHEPSLWGLKRSVEGIVKEINEYDKKLLENHHLSRSFQDLPVCLLSNANDQMKYSIQVIESIQMTNAVVGSSRIPRLITSKSQSLLIYSTFIHHLILKTIADTLGDSELALVKSKPNGQFMDWFKVQLFKPERSLPIFGKVHDVKLPLDSSKFGKVQVLMIDYLSNGGTYKTLLRLSIFLNGTWFKSLFPDQWRLLFLDDQSFWKMMFDSFTNFHKNHQASKRKQGQLDSNQLTKRQKTA